MSLSMFESGYPAAYLDVTGAYVGSENGGGVAE